jgi:hypothetical protein
LGCAFHGICGVNRDGMFVDVVPVHMVEMTVVKIIYMAVVANRRVPAFGAMVMRVVGMMFFGASGHCDAPSGGRLVAHRLPIIFVQS